MQLPRFTILLSLALGNLIPIEAYPVSTSAYPSASTTSAEPRVVLSLKTISNTGRPATEKKGGEAKQGDGGTTSHKTQRRPPADTEPCSKIMGDDRQPDKLDSAVDVKSTIAFSRMNAGTTLNAWDSTTMALFSVPDPNWSGSSISEIATGPTSSFSTERTVETPYPSSTCDDDIRYGTAPTLTPSPSCSEPTIMMTTRAVGSSSRPTGESALAACASAPAPLDAVPSVPPLLQWFELAMVSGAGSSACIYWALGYGRPNPEGRGFNSSSDRAACHACQMPEKDCHCDKKPESASVLSRLTGWLGSRTPQLWSRTPQLWSWTMWLWSWTVTPWLWS